MVGSYHTELAAYAGLRTGDPGLEPAMRRRARRLLRPVRGRALAERGVRRRRCARSASPASGSGAGTAASTSRASRPPARPRRAAPGEINVLYAGRLTKEKGADLLADAFLGPASATRGCTSCSPAAGPRRRCCASGSATHATFLGWLEGEELRRAYASADVFLFASRRTPSAR